MKLFWRKTRKYSKKEALIKSASFFLILAVIFFLVNFDFSLLGKRFDAFLDPEGISKKELIPSSWLERYGIEANSIEDFASDTDQDGLTLKGEYIYLTSPLDPDSDNDGYKDGVEVKNGYNPTGEGRLDMDGDNLPDFWEKAVGLGTDTQDYDLDPDGDDLPNYLEYKYMTNPHLVDTDNDGYSDKTEIQNGFDPVKEGEARPELELSIEKIGVNVPIIRSASEEEAEIQDDLKNGVVKYHKMTDAGQSGNMVISGHSSNYAWIQGNYNHIFKDLNSLESGDSLVVKAKQANGRLIEYRYSIYDKAVVKPDDEKIFAYSDDPVMTLVTCWPLGTKWNRLIIKARLET